MTEKFRSLKPVLIEDTEGLMSPEKIRDVRETGTRAKQMTSKNCTNPSTCTHVQNKKSVQNVQNKKSVQNC